MMTGEAIRVLRFLLFAWLAVLIISLALVEHIGLADFAVPDGMLNKGEVESCKSLISETSDPTRSPGISTASEPPTGSATITITMYAVADE